MSFGFSSAIRPATLLSGLNVLPADDLSFQARASWLSTLSEGDRTHVESGIAEAVADILLEGVFQHSGYAIVLVDVR